MTLLELARERAAAGISPVSVRTDGSKAPDRDWKEFQDRIANDAELVAMFRGEVGIGTICGRVSGGLEAIDIDEHELFPEFFAEAERQVPGLMARLTTVRTPGGYHLIYRSATIEGNQKLAKRAKDDPLFAAKATLIETRGQGGYIIAPGSPASCHETGGTYEHISGPELTAVATIDVAERESLFRVARSFNRLVDEADIVGRPSTAEKREGLAPGDDYNQRASWAEVLDPHGWATVHHRGDVTCWRRPGKSGMGWSATTGLKSGSGNELLCVFSSNAHPFDVPAGKTCGTYTKFAAFALLNHDGDFTAAARALGKAGYGDKPKRDRKSSGQNGHLNGEAHHLPLLANAEKIGEGEDQETHAKSMAEVLAKIGSIADGWPRRVNSTLFVDDEQHGIRLFAKEGELFGWLASKAFISWHNNVGCVRRAEVFAELQRTAPHYRAIETFPHFPPFADHYYSHPTITLGTGAALAGLLDRFSPATPIDRDLILAMFASGVWGGEGGSRPAFVVASDEGRGAGKTALVGGAGRLFGGMFSVRKDEKVDAISKRLLTPEALTKRVVEIDNVKTNRLSWAELEAFITAREISGHQMFAGERTRPNTLLWCITLNGPSLSKDMAQRSVIIKLRRPEHDGDWQDETANYIESNRWQIIGDLAAFLAGPLFPLEKFTRWGKWERDILARLPEPGEAQRVIVERQKQVDADDEESADIEDHFRQQLEALGYDPDVDAVHIPNTIAHDWYKRATGHDTSTTGVTRAINQAANEGTLRCLRINPGRKHGRGLLWAKGRVDTISYDLEQRQRDNSWRDDRHWDR